MARTLGFDYTNAVELGTRQFWKTGYANTSMRELLQAMGIGEGSFYNTLKSKRQAYLECLKHYNATVGLNRGAAFADASTAALGVRALFATVLDCLDDPDKPSWVCLMAASVTREVWDEPELRAYVQGQLQAVETHMTRRFAADRDAGLLPAEFEPETVVPVIVTYAQGMWRMALVGYERGRFERQIELFLTGLGL